MLLLENSRGNLTSHSISLSNTDCISRNHQLTCMTLNGVTTDCVNYMVVTPPHKPLGVVFLLSVSPFLLPSLLSWPFSFPGFYSLCLGACYRVWHLVQLLLSEETLKNELSSSMGSQNSCVLRVSLKESESKKDQEPKTEATIEYTPGLQS